MTEKRRQLLLAYRDSLIVAYVIALLNVPFLWSSGPLAVTLLVLGSGFVFGTSFFLLGTIRPRLRVGSFALNCVAQTGLIMVTIVIASVVFAWGAAAVIARVSPFDPGLIRLLLAHLTPTLVAASIGGGTLLAGTINLLFAISQKLGPGILWNWITGKYYHPREEERIFMFLDMKDSTAIAERLGNLKFSALVRDFFQDMTYPVLEARAQVSHYIGDEAVISWKTKDGLKDGNCIALFFKMRAALEARRDHYQTSYGFVPEFKAGLHVGNVVATEVGEIKSEIVFHGDVLNTTARIQALCNEESQALLISADLAVRLPNSAKQGQRSLGLRSLKGKEHQIEVFAVERPIATADE